MLVICLCISLRSKEIEAALCSWIEGGGSKARVEPTCRVEEAKNQPLLRLVDALKAMDSQFAMPNKRGVLKFCWLLSSRLWSLGRCL